MSNALLEMLDETIEQIEQEDKFIIDSDERAEWALTKIREEQAEAQRLINACNSQILFYQERIKKIQEALEHKTGNLKAMLFEYFLIVPKKATKTQETYTLPSGKLKLKFPGPEFKRDDNKLVEWLESSGKADYIRIKKLPDWAAFKKKIQVIGDKVVDESGEIVDGVEVVERGPEFIVEV